jgi:hypothetical protein
MCRQAHYVGRTNVSTVPVCRQVRIIAGFLGRETPLKNSCLVIYDSTLP